MVFVHLASVSWGHFVNIYMFMSIHVCFYASMYVIIMSICSHAFLWCFLYNIFLINFIIKWIMVWTSINLYLFTFLNYIFVWFCAFFRSILSWWTEEFFGRSSKSMCNMNYNYDILRCKYFFGLKKITFIEPSDENYGTRFNGFKNVNKILQIRNQECCTYSSIRQIL